MYSHNFVACEPRPGGPDLKVTVALRRGVTVLGRIIGPDEQLVHDVWIIGRTILEPSPTVPGEPGAVTITEKPTGRFELHGLDPDTTLPVYLLQPNRRLGATAHVSGKSAVGGPTTIRLEPCGTATARLIDGRGGPIAGYHDAYMISMIIAPVRTRQVATRPTQRASLGRWVACSRSIPSITRKSPPRTLKVGSHSPL